MHSSLKLPTNVIIITACALVSGAISILSHPFPAIPLITGAVSGLAAGFMQNQSIAIARNAFRSAETAMEVRRALTSTIPGKRAIQIQWLSFPLLVASAVWIRNPLGGVAGFGIFMCIRDLITLKAVMGLSDDDANAKE